MSQPLDLSSLRAAIASLDEALQVMSDATLLERLPASARHTLQAGVVQNFEFVYELAVKMLRRQLERDAASSLEIDQAGFRTLIRIAAEKGLLDHVEAWFGYRDMRNITAHTYDREKARRVVEHSDALLSDARDLLERLDARNG